jgi:hypothetical protein
MVSKLSKSVLKIIQMLFRVGLYVNNSNKKFVRNRNLMNGWITCAVVHLGIFPLFCFSLKKNYFWGAQMRGVVMLKREL